MFKKNKIMSLLFSSLFAVSACTAANVSASDIDNYPNKPIKILIGTTAGATTDAIARLYAEKMTEHLGQPVMVENRPGAGTMLASRLAATAAPDGYTLLAAANSIMALPNVRDTGFSTADLVGVGEMSRGPSFIVVSSRSPYNTIHDLIDAAKEKPGTISNATTGPGTTSDVIAKLFAKAAGVRFYPVPYTGSSLAVPDVLEQRVDFMVGPLNQVSELIRGGQMRALAASDAFKSDVVKDVPTFAELGFKSATYPLSFGLLTRAGTPEPIIAKLSAAIESAKHDEKILNRLAALGQELSPLRDHAEHDAYLRHEEASLTAVINESQYR